MRIRVKKEIRRRKKRERFGAPVFLALQREEEGRKGRCLEKLARQETSAPLEPREGRQAHSHLEFQASDLRNCKIHIRAVEGPCLLGSLLQQPQEMRTRRESLLLALGSLHRGGQSMKGVSPQVMIRPFPS